MSTDTATAVLYPRLDGPSVAGERDRGFNQGHAAGYATGLRAADVEATAAREAFTAEKDAFLARAARELEDRKALLEAVAATAQRATLPVLETAEQSMAAAALELAATILGTELSNAQTAARAALSRAFPSGEPAPPLTVRLNPADVALLEGTGPAKGLVLEADPALVRGDAVARYRDGIIDARISTALDRARTALEGTGA